ncbi:hypothetical protein EVAR_79329_1 [Eumeta japonica]|uniref:Uncharacterized protein n=1 Tax=Eumeta variegata TaxID=151549 RepID=A0A4C1TFL0_EUMVA|nr:hypothetical protein EVAR_79329_1 [Eumeta japonica]
MFADEFKEGRPKSVIVSQNIDSVRKLMIQRDKSVPGHNYGRSGSRTYDPRRPLNPRVYTVSRHRTTLIKTFLRDPPSRALRMGFSSGGSRPRQQETNNRLWLVFHDESPFLATAYDLFNEFKRGLTNLADELREERPSTATAEDSISRPRQVAFYCRKRS